MELEKKLTAYYATAISSLLFAVIGFSYNTWRLEVTEDNNNVRTAAFEVLKTLAELEQIIFVARYDNDEAEGNPRKGWVRIRLIVDLSVLVDESVEEKALELQDLWSENWNKVETQQKATDRLIEEIEQVRKEIKQILSRLQ